MNIDPDISVIIPVWNPGEERMRKCLQSLISQTKPRLEFIFVDDTGTDASMDLVREAAESDSRIRIITNKRNLGPGESRNRAIEEARGRYLSFVDADDYVEDCFFLEMYQVALEKKAEIVKPLRIDFLENSGGTVVTLNTDMEFVNWILHQREEGVPISFLFMQNHHGTLFCRQLTNDPSVRFGETICSEDITFLLRVGKNAQTFFFAEKARYFYRLRSNSLSSRVDERRICDQLSSLREQLDILCSVNIRTDAYYRALYFRIRRILQLQLRLCASGLQESAEVLLNELREIIMPRLDRAELCKCFFEIDILYRYSYNLCKTPDFTQTFAETAAVRVRMMQQWAAFAEEHPEERRALDTEYKMMLRESELFCARYIAYGEDDDFPIPVFLSEIAKYRKVCMLDK